MAQFRYRQAMSYYIYLVISGILMLANLVVTMFSAFIPKIRTSIMLQSLIIVDYGSLFIVFSVIGFLLIFYLPYYFGKNYNKQKDCLVKVLPLNLVAVSTIIIRNALSIEQAQDSMSIVAISKDIVDGKIVSDTGIALFWFFVLSDFVPYVTFMVSTHLSSKYQINQLVCGYLYKPGEEDKTTFAGSVMFQELQEEIAQMSDHLNLRSQIFESEDDSYADNDRSHGVHSFQPDLFAEDNVAAYAFRQQDFNDDSLVQFTKKQKLPKRKSQILGDKAMAMSFDENEFRLPENALDRRKQTAAVKKSKKVMDLQNSTEQSEANKSADLPTFNLSGIVKPDDI